MAHQYIVPTMVVHGGGEHIPPVEGQSLGKSGPESVPTLRLAKNITKLRELHKRSVALLVLIFVVSLLEVRGQCAGGVLEARACMGLDAAPCM